MRLTTELIDKDGKKIGTIDLPYIFYTPFRPEVIHKSYVNILSHSFQNQGRYPAAGEVVSAESRNTGLGISRIARARGEGFARAGQAAGVAGVRHGRVAHPPISSKITYKKINKQEKRLALYSAIAATSREDLIKKRGHRISQSSSTSYPIVVTNEIESISKTKELIRTLMSLGLKEELVRTSVTYHKNSRVSRGTRRSSRSGVGVLLVVGKEKSPICKLRRSIAGVDIKQVNRVNILDFAPGSRPIRLTIFTQNAIDDLKGLTPLHRVEQVISRNEQKK